MIKFIQVVLGALLMVVFDVAAAIVVGAPIIASWMVKSPFNHKAILVLGLAILFMWPSKQFAVSLVTLGDE